MEKFKSLVQKCGGKWSYAKRKIAKQAIDRLEGNLPVVFNRDLGELTSKNNKSATDNGKYMTDAIGTWVKKKFMAGPYHKAPIKGFRVNPLMAVVQRTKVRPILNLSLPKGASFNEAVDMFHVPK